MQTGGISFRKNSPDRLETVSVIPRKKALIQGIPSSAEEPVPKLGTERNGTRGKNWFRKQQRNNFKNALYVHQKSSFLTIFWHFRLLRFARSWFHFRGMVGSFGTAFREFVSIFVAHKGIPSCVLFRGMFGTVFWEFASVFVQRNGIPSCVLFRRRVRNRNIGVCFYFYSTERISELFSLPGKDSERNSDEFLFRGTTGISSEITNYSLFRGIIFVGNSQP
jgi:hypothetical protein